MKLEILATYLPVFLLIQMPDRAEFNIGKIHVCYKNTCLLLKGLYKYYIRNSGWLKVIFFKPLDKSG